MEKDLYFKDEETRLIFILVEIYGMPQLELLGLNQSYFTNKEKAKNWYETIKEKLKDSKHPKLDEAIQSLEKLYKGMKW